MTAGVRDCQGAKLQRSDSKTKCNRWGNKGESSSSVRGGVSSGTTSRTVFHFFRDTKVRNLDATLVINEHVGTFDISVDDISLMEVIQPEEDLSDPVTD